jgi:hypothetical protein
MKNIDDNNKSFSSGEEALETYFNMPDEKNKIHILASLNHIKGSEAKINLWDIKTGNLIKTMPTGHK